MLLMQIPLARIIPIRSAAAWWTRPEFAQEPRSGVSDQPARIILEDVTTSIWLPRMKSAPVGSYIEAASPIPSI